MVNDNIIIIYNNRKNQCFHSFYIKAPKYVKQTTHVLKGKVDKSKINIGRHQYSLLIMDKETNRRKARKYRASTTLLIK